MAKEKIAYETFLAAVPPAQLAFVNEMHAYLMENSFTTEIKEAKSGYVVSYRHTPTKKVVMNYVFRKSGVVLRLYADHLIDYMDILDKLPAAMKERIKKAPVCRRMLNPEACLASCKMGFDYILDGERHQKCRNNGFLILIDEESGPWLRTLVRAEVACQVSAS